MKRYGRRAKMREIRGKLPVRAIMLAAFLSFAVFLRLLAGEGAAAFSESIIRKLAANDRLTGSVVAFELGIPGGGVDAADLLFYESPLLSANVNKAQASITTIEAEEPKVVRRLPQTVRPVIKTEQTGTANESAPTDVPQPEHTESGAVEYAPASEILLHNSTDYTPDISALLASTPDISLNAAGPQILIVHTHSSEAYTGDYSASDFYRTEDKTQNVIRVGDELTSALEERGFKVIHDRNIYDYPSYSGSYTRTQDAVQMYLGKYPCISVIIDLHRDALQNADGTQLDTDAGIEGISASKLMFVIGTGQSGLEHPNWEKNLTLAVHLQSAMLGKYPGLCRPIALVKERYNQHLGAGYFILEVGSTGNTLEEAINAARLFAECSSGVFSQYMK